MRIDLGRLATERLILELPPATEAGPPRELRIAQIDALAGVLSTESGGFKIDGLGCARALLDALGWTFGKLRLDSEQRAELGGLSGELSQLGAELVLRIELGELKAGRLVLTLGELKLSARVEARELSLRVAETVGLLQAKQALFTSFELRTGALHALLPSLNVSELTIDWSGGEFRLEVGTAEAEVLHGTLGGAELQADRVEVAALRTLGARVSIGQTRIEQLAIEATVTGDPAQRAEPEVQERRRDERSPSGIDLRLLDGLAGKLGADVVVDVAVPIIGHRRATHELRVGVESGSIDFRELEHGLARLEDSLLDFSVRDAALVLERGLPLIATRGRGKPILIWDLSSADHELAKRGRVRLAVLPDFRVAARGESDPPSEEGYGSAFKLRELSVVEIDVLLTLLQSAEVSYGALRELTFADLTLSGAVHHLAEGGARAGRVQIGGHALRAALSGLPVGAASLSGRLEVGAVRDTELAFEDVKPRRIKARLDAIALADLELT